MQAHAILLAIIGAVAAADGGASDGLETRWRKEYPNAASRWETTEDKILAKGRFASRSGDGTWVTVNALTVASSARRKAVICDNSTAESPKFAKKAAGSTARCLTPDYTFELVRSSPSSAYVIRKYAESSEVSQDFLGAYDEFARNATVYRGIPLLTRLQSRTFSVKSVDRLRDGEHDVVQIKYEYVDESETAETGAVYLDAQLGWAIRKVDINFKRKIDENPIGLKSEVNYDPIEGGVSFPTRAEYRVQFSLADRYILGKLDLTSVTLKDVPSDLFTLSGYGLPEIPLRPTSVAPAFSLRNPLFWGSLSVAVLSFALLRATRAKAGLKPSPTAE
jgi:hypothetical protein